VTLLLPVGMALAVQAKGKVWWVYAAASTLLYGALVGSQTRAAWIACAGAAVLLLGLLPKSPSVYRRLVMLGAVFAAVTAVMVLGSPEALGTRAVSTFDTGDHSLQSRLYMWRQTIPLIMERPALGWGFSALWGRFPVGTPEYLRVFGYTINAIDSPHNELLHVAFATGLIGLGAYLWVWAVIATSLRSMLRSPEGMPRLDVALIASLAAYLVWLQLAWSHIGPAHIFWIFAGVAVALRPSGDHREGVTNQV
jgi:O-antigen ligase